MRTNKLFLLPLFLWVSCGFASPVSGNDAFAQAVIKNVLPSTVVVQHSYADKDAFAQAVIKNVLPTPQQIQPLNGTFHLTAKSVIYFNGKSKVEEFAVNRFIELTEEKHHLKLRAEQSSRLPEFQIIIKNQPPASVDVFAPSKQLTAKGAEAYQLLIQPDGVRIAANSAQGLLWGFMSLRQLCSMQNSRALQIPALKITDWPHYRWRGYMLDTGRSPFSMAQIKRTIRICSAFKLNFLIIREGDDELNAIRYNHLPLGSKNPHALSIQDFTELVAYGEKYGIAVFPEIESLGHAAAKSIFYPDLVEGGIRTDYWPGFFHRRKANLRVGDPRTYKLLESIYDELFPLLRTPMVHLGLDEVRLSREEQAGHLKRLLPIAEKVGEKYGKKMDMIVWSDAPPTPPQFREHVIRCLWVYGKKMDTDNESARRQGLDQLIQPGCVQKVFMAGGSGTHHRPYSKEGYPGAFVNLASWAMLGANHANFIGLLAVQWASNVIDEWFPNFLMAADFGWNVPENMPDYQKTMKRVAVNLTSLRDFTDPDPAAVDRPAWDGIWLNGRYWDEDVFTGKKAAPVVQIIPAGGYFQKSDSVKITANIPNAKIYYTLDGSNPKKGANLYLGPFVLDSTTIVRARGYVAGRPGSYVNEGIFLSMAYQTPPKDKDNLHPGLFYEFFDIAVDSVAKLHGQKSTSGTLDSFHIADCAKGKEAFGFIFSGFLEIQMRGVYTFFLRSNDGSRMFFNGREIINNDGLHGSRERSAKVALKPGVYPIRV
ncbi:MAG: family 20 glycosylhydrolase, partial [Actinobacteria bacterium]|nr:family 20 glycosylhydrolase [Actinomycetota bacterium]